MTPPLQISSHEQHSTKATKAPTPPSITAEMRAHATVGAMRAHTTGAPRCTPRAQARPTTPARAAAAQAHPPATPTDAEGASSDAAGLQRAPARSQA